MDEKKKLAPIVLKDPISGNEYTLEFNRASVRKAESEGFKIEDISDGKYLTGISDLFYYAFYKNHRYMKREQTDDILFDGLKGITEEMLTRLCELYAEPYNTLINEDDGKNSKWTVQM